MRTEIIKNTCDKCGMDLSGINIEQPTLVSRIVFPMPSGYCATIRMSGAELWFVDTGNSHEMRAPELCDTCLKEIIKCLGRNLMTTKEANDSER
jgi:hypothetical protein